MGGLACNGMARGGRAPARVPSNPLGRVQAAALGAVAGALVYFGAALFDFHQEDVSSILSAASTFRWYVLVGAVLGFIAGGSSMRTL